MRRLGTFDRFAESSSEFASHATFFIACVALVAVWLPSYFIFRNLNTWQLIINTATTIVTFLLVALLQNSQRRFDQAMQEKLDAIAAGLADVLATLPEWDGNEHLADVSGLRRVIGRETVSSRAEWELDPR